MGEELACRYLETRGGRILERNYRCRLGEIDIIGRIDDCLVFVEVRYRRSSRFGDPAETVDRRKQQRMIRTAQHYLSRHGRGAAGLATRFDVAAIRPGPGQPAVDWITDAFWAET